MLSPGTYHKLVPKDPLKNLQLRLVLLRASSDPRFARGLMEMCRQDIIFFIDLFVFQINPAKIDNELGPFITWEFQEKAIKETMRVLFEVRDEMIWEKSREMGATWLALIIALWLCLFRPHKRVLMISHSEQAVDKTGNTGSLFAKLDFILAHLPKWMTRTVKRAKLAFNFDNGSAISGFSSTGRSGVGDRAAFILLDEFSKQQNAREILGQTKDVGPCLIVGTHYGVGTCYFDLTQDEDRHKLIFHWSMHPDKNKGMYRYNAMTARIEPLDTSYEYPVDFKFVMDGRPDGGPFPGLRSPWYDNYCRRATNDRDVCMHQDIDAKGSSEQYFDRVKIAELKRESMPPYHQGDILFDPETATFKEFVSGGNFLRLWCNLDRDGNPPVGRYGAGLDIGMGVGKTPTCLSIISADTGEKVAEYITSTIFPDRFAPIAIALCRWFKSLHGEGAKLAWERNGPPGKGFLVGFRKFDYANIYYEESRNVVLGAVGRVPKGEMIPGWQKTEDSGPQLLAAYKVALQNGQITNRSEYALDECLAYSFQKDGSIEHSKRKSPSDFSSANANHGDIVIADALAWKMCVLIGVGGQKARATTLPIPDIYTLAGRRALAEQKRRRELAYD